MRAPSLAWIPAPELVEGRGDDAIGKFYSTKIRSSLGVPLRSSAPQQRRCHRRGSEQGEPRDPERVMQPGDEKRAIGCAEPRPDRALKRQPRIDERAENGDA